MDSTRQQKYARLIQKEVSNIFQHEGYNIYKKAFVTITMVRVSPDLSIAKIYLSIFNVKDSKEVLDQIIKHGWEIRKKLGMQIRHQARIIPELKFFLDDSLDYADKINKLLGESTPPKEK